MSNPVVFPLVIPAPKYIGDNFVALRQIQGGPEHDVYDPTIMAGLGPLHHFYPQQLQATLKGR